MENLKKLYYGLGFIMFFLIVLAISVFPRQVHVNMNYVFLAGVAVGAYFLFIKNKIFRICVIVGVIIFLMYRAGTLFGILERIIALTNRLLFPALVLFIIYLILKPKKAKA